MVFVRELGATALDEVRVSFVEPHWKSEGGYRYITSRLGYEHVRLIHITSPPSREVVLMTLDVTLPTRVCDYFCVVGYIGKHMHLEPPLRFRCAPMQEHHPTLQGVVPRLLAVFMEELAMECCMLR